MRIVVLILGLILFFPMFLQSMAIAGLGDMANNQQAAESGAVGMLVALLWLIGTATSVPAPRGATIWFAVAALFAFMVSGTFSDMAIWGVAALILAVMSYIGHRQKLKEKREKMAYEQRVLTALERNGGAL